MSKTVKDVCGALIRKDGRYLVAKRMPDDTFGGLWEFPGGTVEPGETKSGSLAREIKEELGIDIDVGNMVLELEDEIPTLKINICFFESRVTGGMPRPLECADVKWATSRELKKLPLAPADKKILEWIEKVYEKE